MAPEQTAGRDVDRRADLYSLTVVFYEMVAGCLPREFGAGAADDLPAALLEPIRRGLVTDPAMRVQSAEAWRAAFTAARTTMALTSPRRRSARVQAAAR